MMAKKLDEIIVIDVEATCWEGDPPPGQASDIIEIGACLLNTSTLERSRRSSILVKPERSQVSAFCTRLTTLTPEQVGGGVSFGDAIRVLRREYGAADRAWASYGDYDRRMFERQCRAFNLPYPFSLTHLNVKNLLAVALGSPRELGLDEALKRLGLPLEGTHHRGVDDAWNIAALLAALLKRFRKEE